MVVSSRATIGRVGINRIPLATNQGFKNIVIEDASRVMPEYVALAVTRLVPEMQAEASGATYKEITKTKFAGLVIPLPPLEVQRELVAEIERYQRVIDGARAVVDNWRPQIVVDPEWPLVKLEELCTIVRGSSPRPKSDPRYYGGPVPRLMVADITRDGMYSVPQIDSLTEEGATKSRPMKKGDVIITVSGNPGLPTILAVDACIHDGFVGLRNINEHVNREYLYLNLLQQHSINWEQSVGAVFKNLTTHQVKGFEIPLPSLEEQRAIAAELNEEQVAVNQAERLVTKMEQRIRETIGRVWGKA